MSSLHAGSEFKTSLRFALFRETVCTRISDAVTSCPRPELHELASDPTHKANMTASHNPRSRDDNSHGLELDVIVSWIGVFMSNVKYIVIRPLEQIMGDRLE